MAAPMALPAARTTPGLEQAIPLPPPLHRSVEVGICLFFALMQCVVWLRSWGSLAALEHAQTALVIGYYGTWLALAALSSDAWWRRHRTAVAASRILLFLLPSTRSPQVGAAVVLGRAATPGPAGALGDYLRVAMGTRVLQLAVTGLLLQHPPLTLLLEHLAQSALQSRNALYCRCRLLADPLSRRRMAWVWRALDWLPQLVPLPAPGALGAGPNGPAAASDEQCAALLNMHQLCCGVLLPVVATVLLEPRHARQQGGRSAEGRQAAQQGGPAAGCCSTALQRRAARLWAAAESALRAAVTGEGLGELPQGLLAWMLLGNCWLLSQAAAGPAFAPAS
ncbi:hypothetical protein ABPG75_005132 [Micractinium tetrahymenae]